MRGGRALDEEQVELIIDSVKKGNSSQYDEIVSIFQKRLYHYIYCIVNNTQDAEDILQDTFVMAYRKIHKYKNNTCFSAWLYRIARNLSYDTMKKSKRLLLYDRIDIENMLENCLHQVDVHDEREHIIQEVLEQLNFKEKNILILRIYEEKSYEEIAYIMNIGQCACRKQYERARKKFIKLYSDIKGKDYDYGNRRKSESVF